MIQLINFILQKTKVRHWNRHKFTHRGNIVTQYSQKMEANTLHGMSGQAETST